MGKSELAKTLASYYFGSEEAMVRPQLPPCLPAPCLPACLPFAALPFAAYPLLDK